LTIAERAEVLDAIELLLLRRSCSALRAPAPEGEALLTILRAALRVPDFQRLRPYEFILATGAGLDKLGAMLERAALAAGHPPAIVARAPRMPHRAPLVVIVAARARGRKIVSLFEQQLTAGCAVMAMQMAAVAQGFGGIWRSGWPMFDRSLHDALELARDDQIVGFLYLGTPASAPGEQSPPVEPEDFIRWL